MSRVRANTDSSSRPGSALAQWPKGKGTLRTVDEGTRTRAGEIGLDPDKFKRLRTSEAVVVDPRPKRSAQFVRVSPPRAGTPGGEPR